jgi:hypothetical protein
MLGLISPERQLTADRADGMRDGQSIAAYGRRHRALIAAIC